MPTVAAAIAENLRARGVTEFFGQSLPSLLVLAAEDLGLRQIVYRTENAGGTMADGFARVSGRCSVVVAQNGPAATLLVPPLTEAAKVSIPVLALIQDVPRAIRNKNAFQEIDHRSLFSGCAKWFDRLDDPDRVHDYLDAAFRAATSGRPGPAVLMLPKDVLDSTAPAVPEHLGPAVFPLDRVRPPEDNVRAAARLLAEAERPLVVAGGGAVSSAAGTALARLSDLAALPVATTPMGKGVVLDTAELSVGVVGNYMGPHGVSHGMREWLAGVDTVLFAGSRTNENGTDGWRLFPPGATFIHLDIDPAEIGRNYPSLRLVGDVRTGVDDLAAALRELDLSKRAADRPALIDRIVHSRIAFEAATAAVRASTRQPLRPERVADEINALLPDDAVVVADASYSSIWVANYVRATTDRQRFLLPRGMAGLGWGLPLALGAKAARPSAPVICLVGDGGFAHCWAELETAVRERLHVVVVVLDNAVLGYQKHAEIVQFGRATSAVELGRVDHAQIATACGAHGHTIRTDAELREALSKAIAEPATTVLDVVTDADAYPPITGWETNSALTGLKRD
ncbi:acetolactate synthase-1/2/3 large subunit [Nocardia tenerifensis]|uniref:acetolactate synthase n=3 Tax=Nocardia tenerifensis TaxID=228006 RepID=A0A318K0W0_9NOCA|nr:acetolactate synthase catalytic subunit [Nocardia tenerifensis]PXX60976.1 acetolactate synthase-1/2/3 large subunit [Nocardia tenerifensis]